ncbi:MAG TPA: MFS transporter, partial [Verrucomicrobiae bacterium]|nr:MFS transporter [Verrucomicrobiae bacterium]
MIAAARTPGPEPVARREILAWCLYDFANSSFSVIVTTVVFSRYFQQFVVVGDAKFGSLLWGIAISLSMLVVGLASPP